MAIFDGKNLRGSLGNLSFSKQGKKTIVKSKPGIGGVRQTEATKKCASVFGKHISPFAKQIRLAFQPTHQGFYDGAMVNRMNSAISTIIHQHLLVDDAFDFTEHSFQRLDGFDFNIESPLGKHLLLLPEVSVDGQQLNFYLKDFQIAKNIRFPKNCRFCVLQTQVVLINKAAHRTFSYPTERIMLNKTAKAFKGINLRFACQPGEVVMIGIALNFTESEYSLHSPNGKLFHPAGIVATRVIV